MNNIQAYLAGIGSAGLAFGLGLTIVNHYTTAPIVPAVIVATDQTDKAPGSVAQLDSTGRYMAHCVTPDEQHTRFEAEHKVCETALGQYGDTPMSKVACTPTVYMNVVCDNPPEPSK